MRLFLAAFGFQLRKAWRSPDTLQAWLTTPFLTVVILAIADHSGRVDLAPYAVVAPTLMALWTITLFSAGEMITDERAQGTLEALVATPASFSTIVTGRLCAVVGLGLLAMAEAWLTAGLVFGLWISPAHPVVLLACLLVSAAAMAGTASVLTPLFVLAPSARILQNTLSYPFYLLGGVLVPAAELPEWLRPASRVIFLSWSSDLLRDGLASPPVAWVAPRLAVVALLGAAAYAVGVLLLRRVLLRVRHDGTLPQT
ncbi:ABC transporter permease [Actinophytocola oryzae]|uniref:ABC-2 type transport system permease protein n=1 Tax=Actinophytocola oryzae TaxID=502181 RepID=A0A4R7VHW7_9PSEU|nr:ABC transporter permease [Actinophytocola oryzae]TDV48689.1 ABC-2 type transport system permease protein [Actinophytocola oryzae]